MHRKDSSKYLWKVIQKKGRIEGVLSKKREKIFNDKLIGKLTIINGYLWESIP